MKLENEGLLKVGDVIISRGKSFSQHGPVSVSDVVITNIITKEEYDKLTEVELRNLAGEHMEMSGKNLGDDPRFELRVEPDKVYFFGSKKT
jgi:hypothetical protein